MNRWSLFGCIALIALLLAAPATVLGSEFSLDPQSAPPPIPDIWAQADGPSARQGADQGWLWGPTIRSAARESYRESPDGARDVFYFDKARMEITDPAADPGSPGYVTAGLLVRDLIGGFVQIGDDTYVDVDPAKVPLTGDLTGNPLSPTYATLAPLASIGDDIDERRQPKRVGQMVTAFLAADGRVDANGVPASNVVIQTYNEQIGHNVPGLFQEWIDRQPLHWTYVTGLPLTEPYWVDSIVAGKQKRVLVQAFERRILTYTPDNPDGWKVEAGNAGLHYRYWHNLKVPEHENLRPLAAGVPFGEHVVEKGVKFGVDPFVFAAVAKVASNFDPLATMANGNRGLFGIRPALMTQTRHPLDPELNAALAASELGKLRGRSDDWRAVLAWYYTGNDSPDWSDQGLNDFVDGVLETWAWMLETYMPKPKSAPRSSAPPAAQSDLRFISSGRAAYYSSSYTVEWWERTLANYARWGGAVAGWQYDPNGYYCVHPDFRPGQRLQLSANGITIWCTIGDTVGADHVAQWRARWAVELSWPTFKALGLDRNNSVEVRAP